MSDVQLTSWLEEWRDNGRSKSEIERTELRDPYSHGKRMSRLWRERLGVETEEEHPLVAEVRRLRALLEQHSIDADDDAALPTEGFVIEVRRNESNVAEVLIRLQ